VKDVTNLSVHRQTQSDLYSPFLFSADFEVWIVVENERPKGHALMLAISAGLTPQTLIELGYPRATVYRWNHNYRKAIKALKTDLKYRILCLSRNSKKDQIP